MTTQLRDIAQAGIRTALTGGPLPYIGIGAVKEGITRSAKISCAVGAVFGGLELIAHMPYIGTKIRQFKERATKNVLSAAPFVDAITPTIQKITLLSASLHLLLDLGIKQLSPTQSCMALRVQSTVGPTIAKATKPLFTAVVVLDILARARIAEYANRVSGPIPVALAALGAVVERSCKVAGIAALQSAAVGMTLEAIRQLKQ